MNDVVAQSVAAYQTDAYAEDNSTKMAAEVERFLAGLHPQSVILDAGCGPGRDLARFHAAGHVAVGVDLNPSFAAIAKSAGLMVEEADLRDLPFGGATFDGVWACASLVHLPKPEAFKALTEIRRTVRPGATFYVSVKITETSGWRDTRHGRRYFEVWTPEEFAYAVAASGFRVEAVEPGAVFVDVWARAA